MHSDCPAHREATHPRGRDGETTSHDRSTRSAAGRQTTTHHAAAAMSRAKSCPKHRRAHIDATPIPAAERWWRESRSPDAAGGFRDGKYLLHRPDAFLSDACEGNGRDVRAESDARACREDVLRPAGNPAAAPTADPVDVPARAGRSERTPTCGRS